MRIAESFWELNYETQISALRFTFAKGMLSDALAEISFGPVHMYQAQIRYRSRRFHLRSIEPTLPLRSLIDLRRYTGERPKHGCPMISRPRSGNGRNPVQQEKRLWRETSIPPGFVSRHVQILERISLRHEQADRPDLVAAPWTENWSLDEKGTY